jgi:isopenicillin-N epimerase
VDTLVDGAHAPGMLPLDVRRIGAAYYTGNCHKWLCAPKGAGFLHVRPDRQDSIHPAVISHGYNTPRPQSSRLQDLFDWTGTDDPTPWLCVGEAIRFLNGWTAGGIEGLMRRNRELALAARQMLADRLGLPPVGPEEMTGTMAAVLLPERFAARDAMETAPRGFPIHRLQRRLLDRFGIEVPVFLWFDRPKCLLRISAHAYNDLRDYQRLVEVLGVGVRL